MATDCRKISILIAAGSDRRTAGLRILSETDQVEIRPPAGRQVVGWVRERARAAGLDLAPDAAQALVDLVGEDLSRLAAEVEKASLYAGSDRRVSQEVVRALAGETRSRQYWELTQALIAVTVTGAFIYASLIKIESRALDNTFFMVVGFYFGRTNHQRVGGVELGR